MLQNCLATTGVDEDEDGIKDIVDIVMKKLDEDRDGRVNEQDYNSAVQKDSLLLEIFGQSLPSLRDVYRYLQISRAVDQDDDLPHYSKNTVVSPRIPKLNNSNAESARRPVGHAI